MTIPVYSFYEPSRTERLREHVRYALEAFNESSRLVRYGGSLRGSFYTILRYAIILHDFGKVPFNQAKQALLQRGERLSFDGHEVISAWFADMYLEQAVKDRVIDRDDARLAVLAVLLHHHPMDVVERAYRLSRSKGICVNEDTVKLFYEELKGIVSPEYGVPLKSPVCAPEIAAEVVLGDKYSLYGRYWAKVWVNGDPKTRKTFLLLAQGLIAADYRSARLTRGEGTSEFAKTIQVFLKYYGSIKERGDETAWST